MERVNIIQGPIRLIELHSATLDKHIYLFGDSHKRATTCDVYDSTHILTFLRNIIKNNNDKRLDIFIETSFISHKVTPHILKRFDSGDNYLDDVRSEFKDCLQITKAKCKYPNVNFHYSDIRSSFELLEVLTSLTGGMRFDMIEMTPQFPKIMSDLMGIFGNLEKNKNYILNQTKIIKQLTNIKDVKVQQIIVQFINEKFANYDNQLRVAISDYTNKQSMDNKFSFTLTATMFAGFLMDMYTISRMMRTFSDGHSPKHIIEYAGDAHISVMKTILTKLGFKMVNEVVSNIKSVNYQCLDIFKFKQPFFHRIKASNMNQFIKLDNGTRLYAVSRSNETPKIYLLTKINALNYMEFLSQMMNNLTLDTYTLNKDMLYLNKILPAEYLENPEFIRKKVVFLVQVTTDIQAFGFSDISLLTKINHITIPKYTTMPNGIKSISFRIEQVNEPFRMNSKLDKKYLLNIPDWENISNLSDTLNRQVKRNMWQAGLLEVTCNESIKIQSSEGPDLKIPWQQTIKGITTLNFATDNKENDKHVCKQYVKSIRNRWDVLSKDQDSFEYVTKPLRKDSIELHAIVIISNKLGYIGHIYVWIAPVDPSICAVIGIRSSPLMAFYRNFGNGISRISGYLLEGVRRFALGKNASKIVIQSPIGKMVQIVKKNGFVTKSIRNSVFGYGGGLTNNNNATCYNCYVKEDLSKSFV